MPCRIEPCIQSCVNQFAGLQHQGYTLCWLYSPSNSIFWSLDDPQSLALKKRYSDAYGLALWQTGDSFAIGDEVFYEGCSCVNQLSGVFTGSAGRGGKMPG